MHSETVYATHIRKWLNSEWGKLGRVNPPFDAKRLPLASPKSRFCFICLFHNITTLSAGRSSVPHHLLSISLLVPVPYQSNGCDCGVFVCRYAYNLYLMRHKRFYWVDYTERPKFNTLITKGPAFQFDKCDMNRIRGEISTLINRLSKLYLLMLKEQEKAECKEAKRLFEKEQMICSSPVDSREPGRAGDKAEAGVTGAKWAVFLPPNNVDKSPEYSDSSSEDSEYLEPQKKGKNNKKQQESLSIQTRHPQARKVRPPGDKAGAGAAGAKPGRVVGDHQVQLQSVAHQGILVATRCTKRSKVTRFTIMGRKCALCASDLKQKDNKIIWIRVGITDHPSYEMIRFRNNTCTIHPSDPVEMMWVKWQTTGTIEGISRHQIKENGLQPRQRKQPNFYSEK
jgi:hypothetical protein